MSWQDYVDKQLLASRCVTKAAIAGHDGNIWAKSEGFDVCTIYLFYVNRFRFVRELLLYNALSHFLHIVHPLCVAVQK